MARPVVILFARAPRLGQVKRRLARDVGAVAALRFYRGELARMGCELGRLRGVEKVMAITPDGARFMPATGLALMNQGQGDLGVRMMRAFNRFRHRPVLLVGADIPGLDAAMLRRGLRALAGHGAVFGPALDGGFYLVGMGQRRPARPFAGVAWSSALTLAATLENFKGWRVALLPPLRDVDEVADLAALNLRIAVRAGKHLH